MTVVICGWNDRGATALVDGHLVLIETTEYGDEWLCQVHGNVTELGHHCPHTAALAATPADSATYVPTTTRSTIA